jgi:predicted Na+-dependent transporter
MASILIQFFSSLLLFCLVFGMTATVEVAQMKKQVYNYHALLIGATIQFILLPFIGFLMVLMFRLPIEVGITLLVITSSPGGSYSNWWCSMFNADLALSVTMTALSTMLATIMLPINLLIYTRYIYTASVLQSLDWKALFISLIVVLSGITSGLLVSHYTTIKVNQQQQQQKRNSIHNQQTDSGDNTHPAGTTRISIENMHRNANRMGNLSGLALILLSVTVSSSHEDARIWDQDLSFYAACAFPPLIGLLLAISLASRCQLEKPERVAVSIESCYQNTGIATTVALTMFKSESQLATAIGVPLYYGIVEAILIFTFCIICWKCGWTKAPPHESIFKVIATSYEVENHSTNEHEERTAIEIIFGGDDASASGRIERGKYLDLIFSRQSDVGDYIVDEQTLQQQEIELTEKKTLPPLAPNTPIVTNSPTVTEASDDDEMTISTDDSKTTILIDQLRMKSRLGTGGRKTFSNIRAFATGYRRPLPFIYDTADNDDDVVHEHQSNGVSMPQRTIVVPSLPFNSDLPTVENNDTCSSPDLIMATSTVLVTEVAPDDDSLVLSSSNTNTKCQGILRRRVQYETISTGYSSPRNDNDDIGLKVEPAEAITNSSTQQKGDVDDDVHDDLSL